MPKYVVAHGSVKLLSNGKPLVAKVGDVIELDAEAAAKLDPHGHILVTEAAHTALVKAAAAKLEAEAESKAKGSAKTESAATAKHIGAIVAKLETEAKAKASAPVAKGGAK